MNEFQIKKIKEEAIEEYLKNKKKNQILNYRSDFEEYVDDMISGDYPAVYNKIISLTPPVISLEKPKLKLEEINEVLKSIKDGVYITLSTNEFIPYNLRTEVLSKDVSLAYNSISTKVAYGIVSAASRELLGYMLYYIDSTYIFNYIKDYIVRPTLDKDTQTLRDRLMSENSISKEYRLNSKRDDLLTSFVNELMIGMNYEKATEIGSELLQIGIDYETAQSFLDLMDIYVPDFIYDFFSDNQQDVQAASGLLVDFGKSYVKTFTDTGVIELFKSYSILSAKFMDKVRRTIDQRNSLHGLYGLSLVDGFDLVELKIANKICNLQDLREDELKVVESNPNLRNISEIVKLYNTEYDSNFTLQDSKIIIKSSNHETKVIHYTNSNLKETLNDPFNIFGSDKDFVKNTWIHKRHLSSLNQTVLSKQDRKLLYNINYGNLKLKTEEDIQAHRMKRINELSIKIGRFDKKIVEEAKSIVENGPKEILYMNPLQNSHYEGISDERSVLMILAETEGLYRKISLASNNISSNQDVISKPRIGERIPTVNVDFDRESMKKVAELTRASERKAKSSPIYAQNMENIRNNRKPLF